MRRTPPRRNRINGPVPVLIEHRFRSKLRQVPDNQEVWIDKDGFTSIIFDISERVGGPGSSPEIDGRAMTTHLEDMVGSEIDTVKIWNTAETEFTKMSEYGKPNPSQCAPFSLYPLRNSCPLTKYAT